MFRGMLSGTDEATAGLVGSTDRFTGCELPPFCRCTVMERVLGDGPAKNVAGMIARMSFAPRNRDGTSVPFTNTRSVEKKLLPLKYTSCCAEPSTANVGVRGLVEPRTGSVAPVTLTEALPDFVVSTTEVAEIVMLAACGDTGAV